MANLNLKQIEHLADLAKINLSSEEKEGFASDLSSILDYVEKIAKLKKLTDSVKLASSDIYNLGKKAKPALRSDQVLGISESELAELIKLIPDQENRLVKTKPIFN